MTILINWFPAKLT